MASGGVIGAQDGEPVPRRDVLTADEPTGSLDSKAGHDILRLFDQLNAQGLTIVMVTHEEDVAAYASRTLRLRDGVIERDECNQRLARVH